MEREPSSGHENATLVHATSNTCNFHHAKEGEKNMAFPVLGNTIISNVVSDSAQATTADDSYTPQHGLLGAQRISKHLISPLAAHSFARTGCMIQ